MELNHSTDFADAALVLVGHGSTVNPDSAKPVYQHADTLRGRKIFAEVHECFWKLEPAICAVLRGVFAPRVFIVPLFISEGYFTEEVVPRELALRGRDQAQYARVQKRGEQTLYYAGPVGTHESMTGVILARAREVVARYPFPRPPAAADVSLFIAGHGTTQNENSRQAIERQADLIRGLAQFHDVHSVFMEEEPRIADCYRLAQSRQIVMVPFFVSDGLHSFEDIPVMLGEAPAKVQERLKKHQPTWRNPTERNRKLVWYSSSIGTEPLLAEVILERVAEIATATPAG